ncbi:MAG: ferritin-like domain-containing protein [Gammaproteobacteria bacterium]|jgi:uncharacterized ferritin-like protein (DUF455 family)
MTELFEAAAHCLRETLPDAKCDCTVRLFRQWQADEVTLGPDDKAIRIDEPGRPQHPELVHPRDLPRRSLGSDEGRAALIHAIAHIEFNAINLALDAIVRFRGMPRDYYGDWLRVAAEEASHFRLLSRRLATLGYAYGDFKAHNGLWDMALRTSGSLLDRMALVPRLMEARGLDVTPGMIKRFRKLGDTQTVAILEIILEEEIGHVEAGTRWFHYLCEREGLDPEESYFDRLQHYLGRDLHCPVHYAARLQAGFSESELERLEELCTRR